MANKFKKEEMEAIKQFDSPSIKLMGFKPISSLKNYHNLKSSYFVFPNDDVFLSSFERNSNFVATWRSIRYRRTVIQVLYMKVVAEMVFI